VYERRTHRLLPWRVFLRRAARHLAFALAMIAVAVAVGTIGYHALARLGWIDAFLNASMILSGMGPVDRLVFIGIAGLVLAPWLHRLFHLMHIEEH